MDEMRETLGYEQSTYLEVVETARKSENDEQFMKQELNEEIRDYQTHCKTAERKSIAAMQNEQELIKEATVSTNQMEHGNNDWQKSPTD